MEEFAGQTAKVPCCFLDIRAGRATALDPVSPALPNRSPCSPTLLPGTEDRGGGKSDPLLQSASDETQDPRREVTNPSCSNNVIYEHRQLLREGCNLLEQHRAICMTSRILVAAM